MATLISGWIGHPVLAATSTSAFPVYIARENAGPSAAGASPALPNRAGFAAVVKPALPAVVNIASSHVVHTSNSPMAPFLNDPLFRQFFGNQPQIPREQREQSLGSGVIVSPEGYILSRSECASGEIRDGIRQMLTRRRTIVGRFAVACTILAFLFLACYIALDLSVRRLEHSVPAEVKASDAPTDISSLLEPSKETLNKFSAFHSYSG